MNKNLDVTREEASKRCWRELCLIRGDQRLDDADGEIGEDTANGELDPAWWGAFQNDCDNLDDREYVDGLFVPEAVEKRFEDGATDEFASPVDRVHDAPAIGGESVGAIVLKLAELT
jgi:hypothetical protein